MSFVWLAANTFLAKVANGGERMSAMTRRMLSGFLFSLVAICCASAVVADGPKVARLSKTSSSKNSSSKIASNFGNLPLSFEPNRGQSDSRVKFISRAHNETLFLTQTGATMQGLTPAPSGRTGSVVAGIKKAFRVAAPRVESSAVRMEFVGASDAAKIEGIDRNAGVTNYFVGSNPKNWHAGIPNYSKVRYTGLYRGIDLVLYGDASHFEYDLIVAPGANPRAVRIRFDVANKLDIDKSGDLAIALGHDQVVLRKPVVYQEHAGKRTRIEGRYALLDRSTVAFEVGRYDRDSPLVIDPSLVWATILRGNFLDVPSRVAADSNSNPYVAGFTCSSDFPSTITAGPRAGCDAFVTKLDATSGSVVYSSIFGGSNFDQATSIALDQTGAAYVSGNTSSGDFPDAGGELLGPTDAFVAKLNPDGTLAWARLFGGASSDIGGLGSGWTHGNAIAIAQGCASNC